MVAILVAGCGGGKKSAATQAATTTAAAKTATTATTATATTGGSGLTGLATTANCKQLANLSSEFSTAMAGTDSKDVKKTAALLKQFADKTPSEIRSDFETVAADYAKIADALQGVSMKPGSMPSAKAMLKLQKLATSIDTGALAKASTNIGTWAQKNCAAK
ncbi:MAG: hypothetical protein ACXVZL_13640 [Gaiellaceae bacterium]